MLIQSLLHPRDTPGGLLASLLFFIKGKHLLSSLKTGLSLLNKTEGASLTKPGKVSDRVGNCRIKIRDQVKLPWAEWGEYLFRGRKNRQRKGDQAPLLVAPPTFPEHVFLVSRRPISCLPPWSPREMDCLLQRCGAQSQKFCFQHT
jgi:hypothetical protein